MNIQEALSAASQERLLCLHTVPTRRRTSRPPLTSTCEVLKECLVPFCFKGLRNPTSDKHSPRRSLRGLICLNKGSPGLTENQDLFSFCTFPAKLLGLESTEVFWKVLSVGWLFLACTPVKRTLELVAYRSRGSWGRAPAKGI